MNIYKREMKAQTKSLILWGIGILFMTFGGMSKYGALNITGQDINVVMEAMPKALIALFGMNGLDLNTLSGYFGVLVAYLYLMGAVHAAMLGANIVSKEENLKTSEFLMVKPRTRTSIMTSKILAGFTGIVIFNLLITGMSLFSVNFYSKGENINGMIMNMAIALFLIQCVFFMMGTTVASVIKRPKVSTSAVMSITLLMYVISVFYDMVENGEALRFLTPFRYFLVPEMAEGKALSLTFVIVAILVTGVLRFITYRGYTSRDLYI